MIMVKLIPHVLAWAAMALLLVHGCARQRRTVAIAGSAGFVSGIAVAFALLHHFKGNDAFNILKIVLGVSFLLFWAVAAVSLYWSIGRAAVTTWGERLTGSAVWAPIVSVAAGLLAGAITGFRFLDADGALVIFVSLVVVSIFLPPLVLLLERRLPDSFAVIPVSLASAISGLLLFSSSSILRLDLFSPLTMKVMKFAHDFVHQFFESMLIPDHLFFSVGLWNYIGFLFGNGVGFWGALIAWLLPSLLVLCAVQFDPLPSVANVRQGAKRRMMIAAALRLRRRRLIVPFCAVICFAGAIYQSRFPRVEYWDPKPLTVSASPGGDILIPKKGEIDLEDGKLHKYLFKQGGKEARFFIIMLPDGKLTAVLDACSICKPSGYGQAEGTVICYYCVTLIPLETVGKPGGCNPVPLPFTVKDDGVHIDGLTLINTWVNTVQATTGAKEGGK